MKKTCFNFGCGNRRKETSDTEIWVNVDKFGNVGADEVIDLFKMPYPWTDNMADVIYASHFVEHIPHSLVPYNMDTFPWTNPDQIRLLKLDGFFAFFEECWRILKPNGVIDLEFPYGFSDGAFQDPTHTRYIVLQTLSYLHRDESDNAPFDYGLRCNFDMNTIDLKIQPVDLSDVEKGFDDLSRRAVNQINIYRNIQVKMVAKK